MKSRQVPTDFYLETMEIALNSALREMGRDDLGIYVLTPDVFNAQAEEEFMESDQEIEGVGRMIGLSDDRMIEMLCGGALRSSAHPLICSSKTPEVF